MLPREFTQRLEDEYLSSYACRSKDTRGREKPMEPCTIRTDFQRDRDRIIHCKSFRRLKYKTQVFLAPSGDHYRTRLTHTLEVSQIARTIARALRLNEDLTEAIALGHDLGHTPFGHSGEAVLNKLLDGGFEHNEQSLRVVEKLEHDGKGLNLTYEVRDGILNHKKGTKPCTLEGEVVNLSDRIAYINHDIDDAIRAGVLTDAMIPADCREGLGATHGKRLDTMVRDVIDTSFDQAHVGMSPRIGELTEKLRAFMFETVYLNKIAKAEECKAAHLVETLYKYYYEHLELLSEEFLIHLKDDGAARVTADYIACMTDRYAIADYERLFVPVGWAKV